MKQIATAGNTLVPALLVLEKLGFVIHIEAAEGAEQMRATRGDETYLADDPVALLGLVKLSKNVVGNGSQMTRRLPLRLSAINSDSASLLLIKTLGSPVFAHTDPTACS